MDLAEKPGFAGFSCSLNVTFTNSRFRLLFDVHYNIDAVVDGVEKLDKGRGNDGNTDAGRFLAFFSMYTYIAYRVGLRDRKAAQEVAHSEQMPYYKIVLFILIGMAALVLGGRFLVDNAAAVARRFDISESVIGITILAAGTSLPELMTSIVAARKGSEGLALGNAIGSNIFNIAFVLGICSTISPIIVSELTLTDWVMLLGSCLLVWLLAWTSRKLSRWEGVVLVACYLVYLALLIIG